MTFPEKMLILSRGVEKERFLRSSLSTCASSKTGSGTRANFLDLTAVDRRKINQKGISNEDMVILLY